MIPAPDLDLVKFRIARGGKQFRRDVSRGVGVARPGTAAARRRAGPAVRPPGTGSYSRAHFSVIPGPRGMRLSGLRN
eukprot:750670-Hanusia_phi.AAC.1